MTSSISETLLAIQPAKELAAKQSLDPRFIQALASTQKNIERALASGQCFCSVAGGYDLEHAVLKYFEGQGYKQYLRKVWCGGAVQDGLYLTWH